MIGGNLPVPRASFSLINWLATSIHMKQLSHIWTQKTILIWDITFPETQLSFPIFGKVMPSYKVIEYLDYLYLSGLCPEMKVGILNPKNSSLSVSSLPMVNLTQTQMTRASSYLVLVEGPITKIWFRFDFTYHPSRRCAGIHVAMSAVWLTIASILATFKIDKCKDEFGNIIEPIVDFKSANIVAYVCLLRLYIASSACSFVSRIRLPSPFRCTIRPRSSESEELIFAVAEHVSWSHY